MSFIVNVFTDNNFHMSTIEVSRGLGIDKPRSFKENWIKRRDKLAESNPEWDVDELYKLMTDEGGWIIKHHTNVVEVTY